MKQQQHEAIATAAQPLIEECQAAVGPDEHLEWAMVAYEGANPAGRVLAVVSPLASLALLLVLPAAIVVPLALVLTVAAAMISSRFWQTRFVAIGDHGAVVLERNRKAAGAVLGRLADPVPTQTKDVWRGYELDGETIWVPGTSLDAYAELTAA